MYFNVFQFQDVKQRRAFHILFQNLNRVEEHSEPNFHSRKVDF